MIILLFISFVHSQVDIKIKKKIKKVTSTIIYSLTIFIREERLLYIIPQHNNNNTHLLCTTL